MTNLKNDMFNRILDDVKSDLKDIETGCIDRFFNFENSGMECFVLATAGGYSIVYDRTNDRMIVAYALHSRGNNKGDWGQGYYFMNDGGNDLNNRYNLVDVVELWLNKVFGIKA